MQIHDRRSKRVRERRRLNNTGSLRNCYNQRENSTQTFVFLAKFCISKNCSDIGSLSLSEADIPENQRNAASDFIKSHVDMNKCKVLF